MDGRTDMAGGGALNDPETAHCVGRTGLFRALGGSCQVPPGRLRGDRGRPPLVCAASSPPPDGKAMVSGELRGDLADDEALGRQLADRPCGGEGARRSWKSSPTAHETGRALAGRTVVVTSGPRPRLAPGGAIAAAGGQALLFPLLEIALAADPAP